MFEDQPPEDKSRCFVIMPFRRELDCVYETVQTVAVDRHQLLCTRGDDIYSAGVVMREVWEEICRAHILIADATGRNPNVFYKMGLAHAIGKKVVILAQASDDIPFDLQHRRYIKYSLDQLNDLASNLSKTLGQLRWIPAEIRQWISTDVKTIRIGLSFPVHNQVTRHSPIEAAGRVVGLPRTDLRYRIQGIVRLRLRGVIIRAKRDYEQTSCWIGKEGYWRLPSIHLGARTHEVLFRVFEETGVCLAQSEPIKVFFEDSS